MESELNDGSKGLMYKGRKGGRIQTFRVWRDGFIDKVHGTQAGGPKCWFSEWM